MRPISGGQPSSDDERTLEALPEEPTISAQIDVKAAFAEEDRTMPGPAPGSPENEDRTVSGAVAQLVETDEPTTRQEHTLPLLSREAVLAVRDAVASQSRPPNTTLPLITHPVAFEDPPDEIPGVASSAQRRRMRRIVFGVLAVCGLLCVGALVRQLVPAAKQDEAKPAANAAAVAATTAAIVTATATATPDVPPPAPPPQVAPATEPAAAPAASIAPAPPAQGATALGVAATPPPPSTGVPGAAASAAPPSAPPAPPPRRPEAHVAAAHPRPAPPPAAPAAPKPSARSSIVRDSPF